MKLALLDYAGLNLLQGNRPVNEERLSSISESMKRGDFITPIIVDETTKVIIDGQHRYTAACCLWVKGLQYELPVIYHKFDNPLEAVIRYNSASKNWTLENYIRGYATVNSNYQDVLDFIETHTELKGQYKAACQLLVGKTFIENIVKSGKLDNLDINKADLLYKEMLLLNAASGCNFLLRDTILVWEKVRELVLSQMTFDKFLKKMKRFRKPDEDRASVWVKNMIDLL